LDDNFDLLLGYKRNSALNLDLDLAGDVFRNRDVLGDSVRLRNSYANLTWNRDLHLTRHRHSNLNLSLHRDLTCNDLLSNLTNLGNPFSIILISL